MKIALVGNQNSGKTTLFNLLTGMNAKVGNWPGVTIEKKSGKIKNTNYELIDLPGIYSLSPYSSEERVSTNFVLQEHPDIIINIVDATCLERSLYLTTQLLELDCKVIVVLNMVDMLEKKGMKINIQKIEQYLGTKVCEISALKAIGIDELIYNIKQLKDKRKILIYSSNIENGIEQIQKNLHKKNKRFLSVKILERDIRFKNISTYTIEKIIQNIEQRYNLELEEEIATERYIFTEKVKKEVVYEKKRLINTTELLDKIFLNKFISIPIFICIMFGIYFLSVGLVGKYSTDLLNLKIERFSIWLENILLKFDASKWLISLVVDGIIKGVGTVISFIPQLTTLFLSISILETTGYMSRIGFLLDKIFRRFGLSGKALIPFIIGSGCSVPGIMGTRIIENEDERKMTSVLVPFIPCSAKMPIIALFSGYFFKDNAGFISGSLYILSIVIIIISAKTMKKYIFKNTTSSFVSELPDYRLPNIKYLIRDVAEKVFAFIIRAGSTIFLCSIIVWILLSFSVDFRYGVKIEDSILALIGKKISWIFYPVVGVNSWEVAVSAIQGLIAKEQVISSMSIISGINGSNSIFESGSVFCFFNKASAYAFIAFNLFSAPCCSAISAMMKELSSFRKTIKVVLFQIGVAWIVSVLIYNIISLGI